MLDWNSIVDSNGSRLFSAGRPLGTRKNSVHCLWFHCCCTQTLHRTPFGTSSYFTHVDVCFGLLITALLYKFRIDMYVVLTMPTLNKAYLLLYQSTDLEMDDWRMWRHEWFSLAIALKICIISRTAKRAIKGVFIPLYVSLITWKWKSNYFYSILEVFHKVLWKIKNRVICPLKKCQTIMKNIEISYFGRMENFISSANNKKNDI